MSDDDGPVARASDYRQARIGAAVGLTVTVIVLLMMDALRSDYMVDGVVFGGLLTTIVTLLGIEAGSVLRGKR